jgi:MFS family permease
VDKFGVRFASTLCTIPAAAISAAATAMRGFTSAIVIAALLSSLNYASVLGPALLPMLFGKNESVSLVGFSNAAYSVGAMMGGPTATFIYDFFGSYNAFLILAAVLSVVTLICIFAATSVGARERIQTMGRAVSR